MDEGKPVFESLSELDGKIIAWDEKVFSSLMVVGQHGRLVFVASSPEDLVRIGSQISETGPAMCLIERRFFEAHFNEKTQLKGNLTDG
jgi:hypothetical protein